MALKYKKIKIKTYNYIHKRKKITKFVNLRVYVPKHSAFASVNLTVGLNSALPPSSYVEILTPSITVFRDGNFGRQFGSDEIMRVESS